MRTYSEATDAPVRTNAVFNRVFSCSLLARVVFFLAQVGGRLCHLKSLKDSSPSLKKEVKCHRTVRQVQSVRTVQTVRQALSVCLTLKQNMYQVPNRVPHVSLTKQKGLTWESVGPWVAALGDVKDRVLRKDGSQFTPRRSRLPTEAGCTGRYETKPVFESLLQASVVLCSDSPCNTQILPVVKPDKTP